MTAKELQAQFQKCLEWNDPEQWVILGDLYLNAGYELNAGVCYKNAEKCLVPVA